MYTHTVQIDDAHTRDDFAAIERIQVETWSRDGMVPSSILMVTVESGGIALVARDGDEVVGFSFAVLAYDRRRVWYWSHMAAVLPGHRGSGVGAALKRRQYQIAQDRGIPLITWTFDPLQAGNANFNLNHLGAIVRRFLPDHYGEMDDPLNRGLPSDRFWCEWWVVPDGPKRLLSPVRSGNGHTVPESAGRVLLGRRRSDGLVEPHLPDLGNDDVAPAADASATSHSVPTVRQFQVPDPPHGVAGLNHGLGLQPAVEAAPTGVGCTVRWLVDIPLDFLGLKARDMGLAKEWRVASGQAISQVLATGAVAAGFTRDRERGVGTYLFVAEK